MALQLAARNASLQDLAGILREQHGRKLDVVAPARLIRSEDGVLRIRGTQAAIDADGVTPTEGRYRPTVVADEGIADKLGIPVPYLRRMRESAPDLYDANVNGWLERDGRSFLVRTFRGDSLNGEEAEGIARAFLSDRFSIVDNLDVLMAALDGVKQAGVEVNIVGADLSERRMYVKLNAPQVIANAAKLMERYRSPFTGESGRDNPRVSGGLVISNSETGGGAFSIVPRILVEVCSNGMTQERDALRKVHLGQKMDEGIIRWSAETQERNLALVTSQAADAVRTFLDTGYVQSVVDRLEADSDKPIDKPDEAIRTIANKLRYSEAVTDTILDHFIKGADATAGGVLQAVTSAAQTVEDADLAAELESSAMRAFDLAVAS